TSPMIAPRSRRAPMITDAVPVRAEIRCTDLERNVTTALNKRHLVVTSEPSNRPLLTVDREIERRRLLNERARLYRQIGKIIADSVHVKDGGDSLAVRAHMEQMQQHLLEFQTFRAALDRFHRLYGPLGE